MEKDKLVSPSFCFILMANFLLFFAFYLILPILPFYLQFFICNIFREWSRKSGQAS